MTDAGTYLNLWERIRERVESLITQEIDRKDLDEISRLLERVQKGELAVREAGDDGPIVVNVHIPGVCDVEG